MILERNFDGNIPKIKKLKHLTFILKADIKMTTVYCVFNVRPNGDGYCEYDLLGIGETQFAANRIVIAHLSHESALPTTKDVAHNSMCEDNNYTYIGSRDDCVGGFEGRRINRGYVIEPMELSK